MLVKYLSLPINMLYTKETTNALLAMYYLHWLILDRSRPNNYQSLFHEIQYNESESYRWIYIAGGAFNLLSISISMAVINDFFYKSNEGPRAEFSIYFVKMKQEILHVTRMIFYWCLKRVDTVFTVCVCYGYLCLCVLA